MIDLRKGCHGGAAAGVADALFNGNRRWEPGNHIHLRPFEDLNILPHIGC